MRKKVIASLIIIIMMIMCTFQYSQAEAAKTTSKYFYRNESLGILAYKQLNAFKLSLSDDSTLSEASITTRSKVDVNINEDIKPVEIVFVLDNSHSMSSIVSINNWEKRIDVLKSTMHDLVSILYENFGYNLKIGIVKYSSGVKGNPLKLTNNIKIGENGLYDKEHKDTDFPSIIDELDTSSTINSYINNMIAGGGTNTKPALNAAKKMLNNDTTSNAKKIICLLSDGDLANNTRSDIKKINDENISTIFIFVNNNIPEEVKIEANIYEAIKIDPSMHKNFITEFENLQNLFLNEVYEKITSIVGYDIPDLELTYEINNAGIIAGDDKIIIQADEEIMHGATLEIEYLIYATAGFDTSTIVIKDFYDSPLIFHENQKLITESGTNAKYNWKVKDGNLVHEGTNIAKGEEYEIKLVLSTVLTPTILGNLDRIGNSVKIEFTDTSGNKTEINKDETNNEDIKALDILIIPPTGIGELNKRIVWTLSMTVTVISILIIIVCIIDYSKNKNMNSQ